MSVEASKKDTVTLTKEQYSALLSQSERLGLRTTRLIVVEELLCQVCGNKTTWNGSSIDSRQGAYYGHVCSFGHMTIADRQFPLPKPITMDLSANNFSRNLELDKAEKTTHSTWELQMDDYAELKRKADAYDNLVENTRKKKETEGE